MPILVPPVALVTLADARAELNIPDADTSGDTELLGYINAATTVVEDIAGVILPRTIVGEVYNGGSATIALRNSPVLSVQSVTEYTGVTAYTLTSQPQGSTAGFYGYDLIDARGGILARRDSTGGLIPFQGGRNGVVVSYTAGYAAVPSAVRLGALALIHHWWDNSQRGALPAGGPLNDDGYSTLPGYSVPNFVAEMLGSLPTSTRKLPGIA